VDFLPFPVRWLPAADSWVSSVVEAFLPSCPFHRNFKVPSLRVSSFHCVMIPPHRCREPVLPDVSSLVISAFHFFCARLSPPPFFATDPDGSRSRESVGAFGTQVKRLFRGLAFLTSFTDVSGALSAVQ